MSDMFRAYVKPRSRAIGINDRGIIEAALESRRAFGRLGCIGRTLYLRSVKRGYHRPVTLYAVHN
jgi:hypothetical protein